MPIEKDYLNLAGEYRVCAELLKRQLFATITYGNKKGVDIFAIGENQRVATIEVKSSNSNKFVTSLYQKFPDEKAKRPDFWILYSVVEDSDCPSGLAERFFILSHAEIAKAQAKRNSPKKTLTYAEAAAQYPKGKGVDNVLIEHVQEYENQWDKVIAFCKQ